MPNRQERRAAERAAAKQARRAASASSEPVTAAVPEAETEPTAHPPVTEQPIPEPLPAKATWARNLRPIAPTTFRVLPWEHQSLYDDLLSDLQAEHAPGTTSEHLLVNQMAEHQWSRQRAIKFQETLLTPEGITEEKKFSFYLRLETTHERSFKSCLKTLQQFRAERRKYEIGFESQKRREAEEVRKQEMHEVRVRLAQARAENVETDSEIKQTIQAPFPGNMRVPFEVLKSTFSHVVTEVNRELSKKQAA